MGYLVRSLPGKFDLRVSPDISPTFPRHFPDILPEAPRSMARAIALA
jgi:hypothetical protein